MYMFNSPIFGSHVSLFATLDAYTFYGANQENDETLNNAIASEQIYGEISHKRLNFH